MLTKLATASGVAHGGSWLGFAALANYLDGSTSSFVGQRNTASLVADALSLLGRMAATEMVAGILLSFMSDRVVDSVHGAAGKPARPRRWRTRSE